MDDRIAGMELLALYGDDDRIGSLKSFPKKAFAKIPSGMAYNYAMKKTKKTRKRISGDDERIGAFLPGLKKIGKATSKVTGGIAKAFLPSSLVDAAAKLDPTKKGGSSVQQAVATVTTPQKQVFQVSSSSMKIDGKKIAIIGGAGLATLIGLKILFGSSRK